MLMLLVAISTTLLTFLCAAATLRFLLSRQGWLWVLPFIISLFFLYLSIAPLYVLATTLVVGGYLVQISPDNSVREIIPLIIVLLWYIMIITFRYALKLLVVDNKYLTNTEKNLHEARYNQLLEIRSLKAKRQKQQDQEHKSHIEKSGNSYPSTWLSLYHSLEE